MTPTEHLQAAEIVRQKRAENDAKAYRAAQKAERDATITTRNLWYTPSADGSRKTFTYPAKYFFEYRGVRIHRHPDGYYDYVFAGATIAQRGGWSATFARSFIDELLTGECELSSEAVKKHIRKFLPHELPNSHQGAETTDPVQPGIGPDGRGSPSGEERAALIADARRMVRKPGTVPAGG